MGSKQFFIILTMASHSNSDYEDLFSAKWVIIALISYVTLFNKFKIAFVSAKDAASFRGGKVPISDEEIIKAIEKRIKEKQSLDNDKSEDIITTVDAQEKSNTNEQ